MKIAIGGDHAGFIYKEQLKKYLTLKEEDIIHFGEMLMANYVTLECEIPMNQS